MVKLWIKLQSDGCREVFQESCFGNLIYFLKYMLELSYRNKYKVTTKAVIFETLKLVLRNDFYEIYKKSSSKKWLKTHNSLLPAICWLYLWFPKQLNSTAKNSRTAVFQESFALNFKWNALTGEISWQHTHSKLADIFSHFPQLHHSSVLKLSYWNSAYLGLFQHCNLNKVLKGLYFSLFCPGVVYRCSKFG